VKTNLARRLVAEGIATAMLLAAIVGSGIMGERLAAGNIAIALLANTVATGAALLALILTFAHVSGAHLNPAVSIAAAVSGALSWREVPGYIAVQLIGALLGVAVAHQMFGLPWFFASNRVRVGGNQIFAEFVATFGLLTIIQLGASREEQTSMSTPLAVAAFIMAGYWFTSSTSFANPAVTIARSLSDTFTGIRPVDVPGFICGQVGGATAAVMLCRWLQRKSKTGYANK
jgi:glycerol uptake facilitator-like aquaporin